jgi:membrane fusion protein, multidrug efflux system
MVNRLLAAAVLVGPAALLMGVAPAASGGADNKSAGPSVLVQVTTLQKGSLPKVVTVFGKVEASAAMRQNVTAPSTAVVEDVFVKPGQQVNTGTALIRLGPTPDTAAAYKKAVSALNNARDLLQHTKALLAQHLATRQQVADAQKSVSDAQASLVALSAEGASTPKTLSAPYDGVVTSVSANLGTIVNRGAALLAIARTTGLVLRAGTVPEQAEEIHEGDTVNVSALGGGDDTGTGTVLLRGSIVDPNTGLVPIEIGLPDGVFLSGQTAQARIVTGTVEGYVVPHEAILVNDSGAPYVVQVKDLIAHHVPIRILLSAGARDVIAGALDPKAALVLAGNYQLKDGMKIRLPDPKQPDSK